jgi:hypothetical protein
MRSTYSLVGGEGGADGFGVVSGVGLGGGGGEAGGFVLMDERFTHLSTWCQSF